MSQTLEKVTAAWALGAQQVLPDNLVLAFITMLQDGNKDDRFVAAQALNSHILNSHIDLLYTLLPSLELDQIQSLYSKVFLPKEQQIACPVYSRQQPPLLYGGWTQIYPFRG